MLNTLLQRNLKGLTVDGTILVNGRKIYRDITCVSSYIQQEDLFIGTLSVREHLTFQALLKLPSAVPMDQRVKRVEQVRPSYVLHAGSMECSRYSKSSASSTASTRGSVSAASRRASRAVRRSALRLQERSSRTHRCFSATSPPPVSTPSWHCKSRRRFIAWRTTATRRSFVS